MTNCNICQSELRINESGMAVYCGFCDRRPDGIVKMLDKLNKKYKWRSPKREALDKRMEEIEDSINEVTVLYHCIKCERPTNKYGYCLWCEDMLRDTL